MKTEKRIGVYFLALVVVFSAIGAVGYVAWKNIISGQEREKCRINIPYIDYGIMFVCFFNGIDAPLKSNQVLYQSASLRLRGPIQDAILIDEDWSDGEIDRIAKKDFVSGVWRGQILFSEGRYVFSAFSDDGIEVLVDGKKIISQWYDAGGIEMESEPIELSYDFHEVVVRWYEKEGNARVQLTTKFQPKQ